MEFEPDEINLDGLEKFAKAVKALTPPYIKVGVLGDKANRTDGGANSPTNAEIGAAHEFGSPKKGLPVRSFLRMPLTDVLPKRIEDTDLFSDKQLEEVAKTGTLRPWLDVISKLAKAVVIDAFHEQGWGKWKKSDMTYKKNHMTLTETGQLRDSVDTKVVEP